MATFYLGMATFFLGMATLFLGLATFFLGIIFFQNGYILVPHLKERFSSEEIIGPKLQSDSPDMRLVLFCQNCD